MKRSSQKFEHTVRSDSCWGKVFALFEGRLRAKPATLRFVFDGTQLLPQDSITTSGVRDGATIEISKERRCAKFAICLTPAAETSNPRTVSVSVSLTHQWSFSSTFPTTPTSNVPIDNQRSEWKAELRPDASATKPIYLFWEAQYVGVHFRSHIFDRARYAPARIPLPSHHPPVPMKPSPRRNGARCLTLLPLT